MTFYFQEKHLHALLGESYFAGSHAISSTLSFLTLYLSKSPQILMQLQREIYVVTQNQRFTTLQDIGKYGLCIFKIDH
jgi:hypothetical protein